MPLTPILLSPIRTRRDSEAALLRDQEEDGYDCKLIFDLLPCGCDRYTIMSFFTLSLYLFTHAHNKCITAITMWQGCAAWFRHNFGIRPIILNSSSLLYLMILKIVYWPYPFTDLGMYRLKTIFIKMYRVMPKIYAEKFRHTISA